MAIQSAGAPVDDNSSGFGSLEYAFLGDAVYEQFIRHKLLMSGNVKVAALGDAASELACAEMQAELARAVQPFLSPLEQDILRRGRNAKPRRQPRGDIAAYRMATGLEALLGYLSLSGADARLGEILEHLWQLARQLK